MPKVIIDSHKGLVQYPGEGVEINAVKLECDSGGDTMPSGSLFTLRGSDEPIFFHMGGNQYISNNGWYDSDSTSWKYASSGRAFRWGFVKDDYVSWDSAANGTSGNTITWTTAFAITASNGYVGFGKEPSTANQLSARVDITGSHKAVALAVTGSVDLGGGAGDSFFILPRLTNTQRDALTAKKGMLIYNTSTNLLNYYNGSAWRSLDNSSV
jgi:hypothetical protein